MRDRAIALVKKGKLDLALREAKSVKDPWYRAQVFASMIRVAEEPKLVAQLAKTAAKNCGDRYQQAAVRAWEIAALAGRGLNTEASTALAEALISAKQIEYAGSRAEAFSLLFRAALAIGGKAPDDVFAAFQDCCSPDGHWRCKRAFRDMSEVLEGEREAYEIYFSI